MAKDNKPTTKPTTTNSTYITLGDETKPKDKGDNK
jgi:hypothetical protein